MKIVEDTISKTFIYQNDDNNICIGYQQKHIVTYHYDSEKRAFLNDPTRLTSDGDSTG